MPLCTVQHHHHHLLQLFRLYPWIGHLKSYLPLDIAKNRSALQMNWKSILNFLQKISILATPFSGGLGDEVNFHASFGWHATFYAFLVSILAPSIHVTSF